MLEMAGACCNSRVQMRAAAQIIAKRLQKKRETERVMKDWWLHCGTGYRIAPKNSLTWLLDPTRTEDLRELMKDTRRLLPLPLPLLLLLLLVLVVVVMLLLLLLKEKYQSTSRHQNSKAQKHEQIARKNCLTWLLDPTRTEDLRDLRRLLPNGTMSYSLRAPLASAGVGGYLGLTVINPWTGNPDQSEPF